MDSYELTVGIECHVQLATKTKLFSPADNDARDREPNSVVSPIDYALPGMLPVLNHTAVLLAIKAAKALNSEVARISRFDRKHYFYPDLPKGYQISQMYQPIIVGGYVDAPLESGEVLRVRLHHAHLEEDAGKLTHHAGYSLVDLNRAGTPLIEIVSLPDIHTVEGAKAYASELHRIMTYAGITNGDLYHGNMRFDVNISAAKKGASELGKRAEIKNLNSFRSVERVAAYEFERQIGLLERGEPVVQETRGWNEATQTTFSLRRKEDAQDYRYMPDPDIPPIVLSDDEIKAAQAAMPPLPADYRGEWARLNLDRSVVGSLLGNHVHARLVSEVLGQAGEGPARRVAHWFASAFPSSDEPNEAREGTARVGSTESYIALSRMVEAGELSSTAAKDVFIELLTSSDSPQDIAQRKNLLQVSDYDEIGRIIDEVLADSASQKAIEDVKSGQAKAVGFLVGQAMKRSAGKANPGVLQQLIRQKLEL